MCIGVCVFNLFMLPNKYVLRRTSVARTDSASVRHIYNLLLFSLDDLRLVMTKLNYRLCVKQVSAINYRRSLGSSIR